MEMHDEIALRKFARIFLEELGYKPRTERKYMSQAEAIRILKPVRIGRRRLQRLMEEGKVRFKDKADYKIRNSAIRIYAEDVYEQLNQ